MKNYSVKNIVYMILGVLAVGVGVGLLHQSNFGVDPFSCMNYGISGLLGVSFGNLQLVVNIILFILMLIVGRKYIGLGTLGNMVGVGYVADLVSYIFANLGMEHVDSIVLRVVLLLVGVVVTCFGVGLYTDVALGISPYDALAYIIEDAINGKIKFKWLRVITDIFCVIVGVTTAVLSNFASGNVIGLGTIIMMFCTGPLVQYFKDKLLFLVDVDIKQA